MKNIDTFDLVDQVGSRMTSLACVEMSSVGFGFKFLAELTRNAENAEKDIHVVEASPGASRFVILALGEAATLRALVEQTRNQFGEALLDVEIIDRAYPAMTEAIFKLAQIPLADSLVTLECKTVSRLLSTAHELISDLNLKAIEIKIQRAAGGGHAFFTGTKEACEKAMRTIGSSADWRVELIENPPSAFREFFNFKGTF